VVEVNEIASPTPLMFIKRQVRNDRIKEKETHDIIRNVFVLIAFQSRSTNLV